MFDYQSAFSRNLGWTTEWEQAALQAKCVAIAGMGGVGGGHFLTLARLGVGAFNVADMDRFDLVNLNRQAGATTDTLGQPKVDVMSAMALAINPGLRVARFPMGVTLGNLDAFLEGCDLFVDALDFFAVDIRMATFARAAELGIPAVTAAPIGMGVGFLAFVPGGQTFEQYFRLQGQTKDEQYLRFLMGVAPKGLHRAYLVDETRVDLAGQRGPSTAAACELCAGMVATQALKLLLGRGGVPVAPVHLTFDAYVGRLSRTRLRWGNAGPVQTLKRLVARRMYRAMAMRSVPSHSVPPLTEMAAILDAARWAPSGDNGQPWRFEILGARRVRIHLEFDPSNPYEYRAGEPVLLAGGMLLESLRVAASAFGLALEWQIASETGVQVDVELVPDAGLSPSALLAALPMRSVVRTRMGSGRLTEQEKAGLAATLGSDLQVRWHESWQERLRIGRLGTQATAIRLRAPEAYRVHRRVLDWERRHSPDGLPARAIGLGRATLAVMRWGMRSWPRMVRLNALMGTGAAAAQLDMIPSVQSAAFFSIHRNAVPDDPAGMLRCGEHLQRFWLEATKLGLGLQPALATVIFAQYGLALTPFTGDRTVLERATRLSHSFERVLGPVDDVVFLARIGRRRPGLPGPRSVRKPLTALIDS